MAKKTQKTHKATKKVLNIRQSGSISIAKAGGNHKTGKKSQSSILRVRKGSELSKPDTKKFKSIIDSIN
ncbi:MAG TPA: 50S ribosomal protein L35 [Bacilli bacterium]|nr:50S ribosomal protein L35 [Bacilli bacterium]